MNPYAANASTQSTFWGTIWKVVVGLVAVVPALLILEFFICKDRMVNSAGREALERARGAEGMAQLDRALLPLFEKEETGSGQARYVSRPYGKGICGCSPAVVDVVEVAADGSGQITHVTISQSIGLSRPGPGPRVAEAGR